MERPKTYTEGTMTFVPLPLIVDAEDIPYRPVDATWAEELSRNIEERGLDTPLLVWNGGSKKGEQIEIPEKGKFPATYLIAGQQRRAALKLIRKRSPDKFKEMFPNGVPVIVKGGEQDEFLLMQLRENVTRKEMAVKHILPVMKKLKKEHGMKQREIAKAIGKHESYVSQIFDAEETLGEEETADVAEDGATVTDVRKAAKAVKEKVKAGKDKKVAAKEEVEKIKKKVALKKATGRQREERRVSAKTLWKRYTALPRGTTMGKKVEILEATLAYIAGDENFELPEELEQDAESESEE